MQRHDTTIPPNINPACLSLEIQQASHWAVSVKATWRKGKSRRWSASRWQPSQISAKRTSLCERYQLLINMSICPHVHMSTYRAKDVCDTVLYIERFTSAMWSERRRSYAWQTTPPDAVRPSPEAQPVWRFRRWVGFLSDKEMTLSVWYHLNNADETDLRNTARWNNVRTFVRAYTCKDHHKC